MRKNLGRIAIILGVVLLGALLWLLDIPAWQRLDLDKIHAQPEATIVYDVNGANAGTLYATENRQRIVMTEVPEHVVQAFIAAEDQRFFSHHGVDLRRIIGALWHDVRTMSLSQGASTITQQLIKLTHLSGEKTLSRKVQEIFLALQLENKLSKDAILEAYLNTVYFGSGAYGIQSAARVYFSKNAADLSLAEGALLAGVIKSPGNYAPHNQPSNALKRRNLVLDRMLETGAIDSSACAMAKAESLGLRMEETAPSAAGWYMDQVLAEAEAALEMSTEEILSAGLRIHTALEPQLQQAAEALFENGASFPDPAADGTPVQAALIAMDTRSGEIRAIIGGRDYAVQRGLNRASQIRRQPGSAIKPISTYAAAIDSFDMLPTSTAEDVRRSFEGDYNPGNAGGNYYGTVTLREALSRSLNVATVDLAELIGMQAVRRSITQFGIELDPRDVNLALSLGSMTQGVSPARLCAAYCALANGGTRVEPHAVRKITDADGRLLYSCPTPENRAVRESTAFLLTDMLKTAASTGSARALAAAGMPVAGKTGTVGEDGGGNRDIWTVGYTPELAVAVWMGFDDPGAGHALPDYEGGSASPARLCTAMLKSAAPLLSGNDFPVPAGLAAADIDRVALEESGQVLLATAATPEAYVQREWFYADDRPTESTRLWSAPAAVDDLRILSGRGESPSLAFTCRDNSAEYLILRRTGDSTQLAAVLTPEPDSLVVWTDVQADLNLVHEYSVLPRHRLLYECGTLLTGPESERVQYAPRGLLSSLFDS